MAIGRAAQSVGARHDHRARRRANPKFGEGAMDDWRSQMIAKLFESGWRMVCRERDDLHWWADEIWVMESEWAPQGFTVYLTCLVDPQLDDHRQHGQAVWAVGTSLHRPKDRREG